MSLFIGVLATQSLRLKHASPQYTQEPVGPGVTTREDPPADGEPMMARLSLRRCREILGSTVALSDADLVTMRDRMYDLASVAVEIAAQKTGDTSTTEPKDWRTAQKYLTKDEQCAVEERAAIIEFDGQCDRDVAERDAVAQLVHGQTHTPKGKT